MSGYQTRFLATIKELTAAGCEVLVVTPGREGLNNPIFQMYRFNEWATRQLGLRTVRLRRVVVAIDGYCKRLAIGFAPQTCGAIAARWPKAGTVGERE